MVAPSGIDEVSETMVLYCSSASVSPIRRAVVGCR
jgi:hypothetical protein